jgi:hypothetical protein
VVIIGSPHDAFGSPAQPKVTPGHSSARKVGLNTQQILNFRVPPCMPRIFMKQGKGAPTAGHATTGGGRTKGQNAQAGRRSLKE